MPEGDEKLELIQAAQKLVPAQRLSTSVQAINAPLADFLEVAGLPTSEVLVTFEERRIVLNSFNDAIAILPADRRGDAHYLSKFVVAISMGLFDAALNYLWNETVAALRRLVARTDLEYFFDAVEKRPGIRKKLQTADDLPEIGEAMLVEGCHRIGLLTNVNYERLKHTGEHPVVGVNTFLNPNASLEEETEEIQLSRASKEEKDRRLEQLADFQRRHAHRADKALELFANLCSPLNLVEGLQGSVEGVANVEKR